MDELASRRNEVDVLVGSIACEEVGEAKQSLEVITGALGCVDVVCHSLDRREAGAEGGQCSLVLGVLDELPDEHHVARNALDGRDHVVYHASVRASFLLRDAVRLGHHLLEGLGARHLQAVVLHCSVVVVDILRVNVQERRRCRQALCQATRYLLCLLEIRVSDGRQLLLIEARGSAAVLCRILLVRVVGGRVLVVGEHLEVGVE
mmetsp:Transcript_14310/g.56315  ORF Transcript_14310/g.56315 Transcript_14310/m.56315 type:complete len:205 (-) Transcript_14310:1177-1791(-)